MRRGTEEREKINLAMGRASTYLYSRVGQRLKEYAVDRIHQEMLVVYRLAYQKAKEIDAAQKEIDMRAAE